MPRALILGVNGFIGNHLTERLLKTITTEIYGLDIGADAINTVSLDNPRFPFRGRDISIHSVDRDRKMRRGAAAGRHCPPIRYTQSAARVSEGWTLKNLKIYPTA